MKTKIFFLYHFYYPDDVVSARAYQQLCETLALDQIFDIEIWPSNRSCHQLNLVYPIKEKVLNVSVWRVWRFNLSQKSTCGRFLNTAWMLLAWVIRIVFLGDKKPDVVVVGTDPVLAIVIAPFVKLFAKSTKIVHWCFDLYPEAAAADQIIKKNGLLHRFLFGVMGWAYKSCDLIADLGPCMKEKLMHYSSSAQRATLTPWAFYEPAKVELPNADERQKLFSNAKLGILYSGNFGLAHAADLSLRLAKELETHQIKFCFSIRGHRTEVLKKECLNSSIPVNFVDFASEQNLNNRLEAADIHLVSLKEAWTGTVVPSKFFGAIAAGRPVLFEGSQESSIAKWISEFGLGWVLTEENYARVTSQLVQIAQNPSELNKLKQHCLDTYQAHFSRRKVISAWNELLVSLTN